MGTSTMSVAKISTSFCKLPCALWCRWWWVTPICIDPDFRHCLNFQIWSREGMYCSALSRISVHYLKFQKQPRMGCTYLSWTGFRDYLKFQMRSRGRMQQSGLNRISGLSQVPDVKHGGDEPICLEPDFGIKSRSRCGTGRRCSNLAWTGFRD